MTEGEPTRSTLEQALEHHQAGRLEEAERGYRDVLRNEPDQPDALHLLGALEFQLGRHEPALQLIGRAIRARPEVGEFRISLGKVLAGAGRGEELKAAYADAYRRGIASPELHFTFGTLLRQVGAAREAMEAFERALVARPDYLEACCALGETFLAVGQADDAIRAIRAAISLQPHLAGAHVALALAMFMKNDAIAALPSVQQALSLDPQNAMAMRLMAVIMSAQGDQEDAIQWAQRGIRIDPNLPELHCTLGSAMLVLGRPEQAIAALQKAIDLRPDYLEATHDLGFALLHMRHPDDAIAMYRRAIAAQPHSALAHHSLGHALLLTGEYRSGWPEYEWRYRAPQLGVVCQSFAMPMWDGTPLHGKTILVHAEQGFGDTIHFVRYIPQLRQRGAKVILQCQPELTSLLKCLEGIEVLSRGEPLPPFDVHCPLLSLPRVFDTSLETIPTMVPYLTADPAMSNQWRQRLVRPQGEKRIGLVWSGGPQLRSDRYRNRSVPLALLRPILQAGGSCFVNLQTGEAAREIDQHQSDRSAFQIVEEPADFGETAARMQNLDLIITVDTAAAHLAGALGRPTWLLLPYLPDWRWMLDREDSPWYPTLRLFRAAAPGEWDAPIRQIVVELSDSLRA